MRLSDLPERQLGVSAAADGGPSTAAILAARDWKGDRHDRSPVLHSGMAMGRRKDRWRTPGLWIATSDLPATGGHPFYQRLNRILDDHAFDDFVEAQCAPFYAATRGRPSLTPGIYFRLLLIGTSKGSIPSAGSRGGRPTRWRCAASLACAWRRRRRMLGAGVFLMICAVAAKDVRGAMPGATPLHAPTLRRRLILAGFGLLMFVSAVVRLTNG